MTITVQDWLGILIIVLQAAIAVVQVFLHQQNKVILAEIRLAKPTIHFELPEQPQRAQDEM